jgi:Rrf2 family protein
MTLFSRKVDYGLLILSHLYHKPEGGSAREIAAAFGLSRAFVANILKELCHKGFVASHRGVRGGYALQRPPEEINLASLMEALEDQFHLAECNKMDPEDACGLTSVCPVKGAIGEVHRRIRELLRNVNLVELFGPVGSNTPIQVGLSRCAAGVNNSLLTSGA